MEDYINYSNIEAIDTLIRRSIDDLFFNGYEIVQIRNINYGTRFKFSKDDDVFSFTVYFSEKKGASLVKDQNITHPEYYKLLDIINKSNITKTKDINKFNTELTRPKSPASIGGGYQRAAKSSMDSTNIQQGLNPPLNEVSFNKWIGTDEAGKGDYFGPLVVAGFCIDKSIIGSIESLGIKDSKKLSDDQAEKMFQHLENNYLDKISVKMLMPSEYSKMILNLKKKGYTLNDLLGILHSQVIIDLYDRHSGVEGIITDQFTHQDKVYNHIKDHVEADFIQRTKAESDVAVAAASVIARAVFLRQLKILGKEYKTVFPKGASNQVISWATDFCSMYCEKSLSNVAKLHFKTTNNILDKLGSKKIDEI